MTNQLAFAGDLHASNIVYARHPTMRGDSRFALQQISDFCRTQQIPLVLLGDNFDKRSPDAETLSWFLQLLDDVETAYIVGQHDMQSAVQWPSVARSTMPRHFIEPSSACLLLNGFSLWGFSYLPRPEAEALVRGRSFESIDVLCLHQLFPEVMGLEGSWSFDPAWVTGASSAPRAILAGDYHGMPNVGLSNKTPWYYTGSMYLRSVSEPVNKSFILATKTGSEVNVTRIPLITRPTHFAAVATDDEFVAWYEALGDTLNRKRDEALSAGAPAEVSSPFVALRFPACLANVSSLIEQRYGEHMANGLFHLHLMPVRDTAPEEELPRVAGAIGVQDVIDAQIDREQSPQLHTVVTGLAHAHSPAEWLADFRTQNGVTIAP